LAGYPKIKLRKVTNFRPGETAVQPTTIHHDLTIKTPQQNARFFPNPHQKKALINPEKTGL
jgi:hypothetical protein